MPPLFTSEWDPRRAGQGARPVLDGAARPKRPRRRVVVVEPPACSCPWLAPACTHPGAEGACTSHRSVPHSSSTDRHVQGSALVDPWTVHTAPTRSVTTSYLCGPGFPGASPCLKRRACIQIREVNRDLRAPAHRHLVVTGSAQLHVEVAPRSTVHWWSASNVLPYPL